MRSEMLQLMLLVIVLAVGTAYIVIGGRRADRVRRGRFSDREDVSFDRFYAEHYEVLGFDREKVKSALNDVAQAIGVPSTKLRPTDRFDVELAAERGWAAWIAPYSVTKGPIAAAACYRLGRC